MSLCIAATCRSEGEPAIVVCCDKAGTRGDIKSDDIVKIRDVGSTVVLLAGDTGQAKALLAECRPVIEAFPVAGDDAEINKLLTSLPQAIKRRKRAIADDELAGEFGVTWDEVFNFSQAHPDDPRWADAWRKIRSLNLGAALIIGTFTDDEVAIVTVDMHGKIGWSDHYAAIGSGSAVAGAFLNQREYDDEMGVPECIYRVMEAKIAAERNPHVGRIMNLEVRTRNSNRFIQSIYHDKIRELIKVQRALPEIPDLSSIDFTEGILPVGGTSDAVSSGE